MLSVKNLLNSSWRKSIPRVLKEVNFDQIKHFVTLQEVSGKTVFPPKEKVFEAFIQCPYDSVKVVILGQDPYHNHGQAHGLSFSVPTGKKVPPSLRNIFKELSTDLGQSNSNDGNLKLWAKQGVLLLNTILTVNANEPSSHKEAGWEAFTDAIIQDLSEQKEQLVFMLWGKYAQSKTSLIDTKKHLVLTAAHPSPFSAHRGFLGCRHFSKANEYLVKHSQLPIDWSTQSPLRLDFPPDQHTS